MFTYESNQSTGGKSLQRLHQFCSERGSDKSFLNLNLEAIKRANDDRIVTYWYSPTLKGQFHEILGIF
jgi:hypothetical protein